MRRGTRSRHRTQAKDAKEMKRKDGRTSGDGRLSIDWGSGEGQCLHASPDPGGGARHGKHLKVSNTNYHCLIKEVSSQPDAHQRKRCQQYRLPPIVSVPMERHYSLKRGDVECMLAQKLEVCARKEVRRVFSEFQVNGHHSTLRSLSKNPLHLCHLHWPQLPSNGTPQQRCTNREHPSLYHQSLHHLIPPT